MKKFIGLGIAVAVVVGLIASGTWAVFTDTETSKGNSLTAGIIDIELSHLTPEGAIIDIDDIKPCQIKYGFFDIHGINNTNPGPVFIHFTGIETSQGLESLSAELKAEHSNGILHDIDNWLTISLIRVTERPPSVADITPDWLAKNTAEIIIHHDDHMKLGDLDSAIIPVGDILGESDRIWLVMDVHLQMETPNDYQGDTCTFTVEAIMTQLGAPPPIASGNKIILENKDTTTWLPKLGDGIWGIVEYNTSSLTLDLHCVGLPASTNMQVSLYGCDVNLTYFPGVTQTVYEELASALGAQSYESPPKSPTGFGVNFVRGYYTTGPNLTDTWAANGQGVYNIAQGTGGASFGGYDPAPQTTAGGELDDNITTTGLPVGDYMFIKVLIKEDGGSYDVHLMEKDFGLFFEITP